MTVDPAPRALTLDALFRRAGVRNAQRVALADPPNRADITGGAPRALTFAQADRAISAFAATLRGLGLYTGAVVGLQLPNTVESVIAFLGTLRAGMVERTEGYARVVLDSFDVRAGEVVVIVSNSGINPVPIELAMEARERGAATIGS